MIPTIGIMIGAYIILRCVELMCANEGRFVKPGAKIIVTLFAMITTLTAALSIYALLHAGTESIPGLTSPQLPWPR